ncbi:hypothetical protein D3C76_1366320 [compost metagenome]
MTDRELAVERQEQQLRDIAQDVARRSSMIEGLIAHRIEAENKIAALTAERSALKRRIAHLERSSMSNEKSAEPR